MQTKTKKVVLSDESGMPQSVCKKNKKGLRGKDDLVKLGMCVIPLIKILVFSYLPMIGLIIAFERYVPRKMFFSPWVGFKNFKVIFATDDFFILIKNAIVMNLLHVVLGTIVCVSLALFMHQMVNKIGLRVTQTILMFPIFLSWALVAMLVKAILGLDGVLTDVIYRLFNVKVEFYNKPEAWPLILTLVRVWKTAGFSAVINYTVLLGVDKQIYEAAEIDGASRFHQMRYISIPSLKYMIIIDLIMVMGNVLKTDFEMNFFIIGAETQLYKHVDVLESYMYRALMNASNFSTPVAMGLFQGIIGLILSYAANRIVARVDKAAALY